MKELQELVKLSKFEKEMMRIDLEETLEKLAREVAEKEAKHQACLKKYEEYKACVEEEYNRLSTEAENKL